jgi:hypothetical protein
MLTDIENDRDDTAAVLVENDGPPVANGKILDELDNKAQPTGYKLFVPTEEEQRRMEERFAEEADLCEGAYKNIWTRMRENLEAYEAMPDAKRKDFMTLPYGKRDVNHLAAFFVNRIYNKNPICSVTPEEYGDYEVPIPQGPNPMTGETLSRVELRSAEELAEGGERLMEHYLRGPKLKFRDFLYTVVMSCVQGAPAWGKTCYERVLRPQLVPKWVRRGSMVVADGYQEVQRVVGSPHRLIAKSGFDVMMADPWLDPQEAEMLFDHCPMTITEGRQKKNSNEWYLVSDDDWETLRKSVTDLKRYEENGTRSDRDRQPERDRKLLDVYYVSVYWPIIFSDENGEDTEGVFSLDCAWERTTGKLLSAPLNQYAHGMRNLVPYVQRPRPFEMSSYSTMEDVLPLQKVGTRLWHSQIQNAMLANTVFAKVRPGSTAWQWLKSNEIRGQSKVPVQNDGDFKSEVLGRELRPLANELAAIDAMSKQLTVSDTVKGANLLGRTSRAAISLVQEAGLTVPNMDLDFLTDRLSQQLTMLYRNLGQWSIYGEEIPFRDPETRAIVMKAIEFPLDGLNQFSVRISASSDEETVQFEFERDLGLAKLQGEKVQEFLQVIAPMLNPQAPPVVEAFHKPQAVALQLMMARIYELAKLDPKKYTLTERQIDQILADHRQWIAQEQERQAKAAADAPPPAPPQPRVSISLAGKLTPEQEAAAAATQGIGGQSAIGSATGRGGAVVQGAFGGGANANAPAPNAAGAAGMGAPPSNAGVPPPPPMGMP